jgi:hypothetical protein
MLGKRDERDDEMNTADGQEDNPAGQQSQQKAKPLRFVTNYGAPHPKRRRIGAACLTCTGTLLLL